MEEYIDLYDKNMQKTDRIISRLKEKELPEDMHILVSALIIKNYAGKIMLQLTSEEKGNIYSLPSGHVLHGESSREAIVREIYEEQGIVILKDDIMFVERRLANRIAIFDIYYIEGDYKKEEMKLQKEEVADVIWFTIDEIDDLYNKKRIRKSSYDSIKNFLNAKLF
jgi:NADH pyrophosphatase NudC (nudix superfamily)